MRKSLSNKLLMFWAVLEVLAKFKQVWESVTGFLTVHNEFKVSVENIQKTANAAGVKTGPITKGKNKSVESFVITLFGATSIISAFATRTGNAEMKSKVDYTESELKELRPDELLGVSEDALEIIKANTAALTALGLKEETVETLTTFVAGFTKTASATRTTITGRKAAGGLLKTQFKGSDVLLKEQLDNLMEQFRESTPEFYAEYWNAREKVDYGIRHEEEEEKVTGKR